jgi:SAM-dependent methyltransferase
MPDVFSDITNAPADVLDAILDTLEKRAADPRLQAMLDAYLSEIELPNSARVLEVGSGTGPVARRLARIEQAQRVIGLDPSPVFLAKAHELAHGIELLCHVPEPETVLRESHRVLKPGATLAVFDCDFSTASLSTGDFDPFQTITDVMVDSIVHDRWFVRKMRGHLKNCGFEAGPLRSYAYSEHPEPSFMFTWIERGAAALIASGRLGEDGAAALRAEAERRVQQEQWYGYVSYASVISRKPA